MAGSPRLFEHDLPPGVALRDNFITAADERVLLDAIADIAFSDFAMRGVIARRRVAFFGQSYDRMSAGPLPTFLLPSGDSRPPVVRRRRHHGGRDRSEGRRTDLHRGLYSGQARVGVGPEQEPAAGCARTSDPSAQDGFLF